MAGTDFRKALIVGAGAGLSAALARAFAKDGLAVALAARSTDDLGALAAETGAQVHACDASRRADVERLFAELDAQGAQGVPDVVAYNASYRTRGPFVELDADEVEKSLRVSALAGFFVAQAAARRMLKAGHGAIFFTGASASVKGYAQSAPFAMGKFALRGLAQSMARELAPQGIHVAHVVIDGGIRSDRRAELADKPGSLLDPDAIAASYLHLLHQPKSAWSWEIEVRPWVEKF
jgi:NAD(P)-dependent dehydrogenase (short-subunit alcohol dehydrogenase family)